MLFPVGLCHAHTAVRTCHCDRRPRTGVVRSSTVPGPSALTFKVIRTLLAPAAPIFRGRRRAPPRTGAARAVTRRPAERSHKRLHGRVPSP
ncbi:hypothetical protein GCM10010191_63580 [Actinomadura vinacea]|uniref:Secreted protein n=1 Tax=Actinomadura vinacea TaxID=115336 RepID=A0ABN3JWD4_9ACTN